MALFTRRHASKAELDQVESTLNEIEEQAEGRRERVEALQRWLLRRTELNGLGADIEWTIRQPRGRHAHD